MEVKYTFVAEDRNTSSFIDYIAYTQDLSEKNPVSGVKNLKCISPRNKLKSQGKAEL